jgi:hypothetical protein
MLKLMPVVARVRWYLIIRVMLTSAPMALVKEAKRSKIHIGTSIFYIFKK